LDVADDVPNLVIHIPGIHFQDKKIAMTIIGNIGNSE
jgi:hypothetical protein